MDEKAIKIAKNYIEEPLDKSYLLSSTLPDGMYYELTYNGDKKEWYLDAYKKVENKVVIE